MERRKFIQSVILAGGAVLVSPTGIFASGSKKNKKLVILHTNDMHSHIEPFEANDPKYPGKGGIARRATMINKIREEGNDVLLVDCGDIFQGTPYFNYYLGELEIKLMNEMGYDACTIGNHDFDGGLQNLSDKIDLADFDFINCNYDFRGTVLEGKIKPYKIIKKSGLKIGLTGVGIKLEGLVDRRLYGGVKYNDPVEPLNKVAETLKKEGCDLVICLSHIGYEFKSEQISDLKLAPQTSNVDIIVGGHTHTFLKLGTELVNKIGKKIIVSQAGWAGLILGKIEVVKNAETAEVSMFSDAAEIS